MGRQKDVSETIDDAQYTGRGIELHARESITQAWYRAATLCASRNSSKI
jgi:hypothetical protein